MLRSNCHPSAPRARRCRARRTCVRRQPPSERSQPGLVFRRVRDFARLRYRSGLCSANRPTAHHRQRLAPMVSAELDYRLEPPLQLRTQLELRWCSRRRDRGLERECLVGEESSREHQYRSGHGALWRDRFRAEPVPVRRRREQPFVLDHCKSQWRRPDCFDSENPYLGASWVLI